MSEPTKIFRKTSISSQASGGGNESDGGSTVTNNPLNKFSARRVSISKASNLEVALSGGTCKSKTGTLRRKSNSIFATFRDAYVSVDDGDLTFQITEDDYDRKEVYSLLSIREIKLSGSGSSQFIVKLAEQPAQIVSNSSTPGSSSQGSSHLLSSFSDISGTLKELSNNLKHRQVVLKAGSHKEAMEWIATIKHELKNQILVCKSLYSTLQSEGHQDRAEPLFLQMIELYRVVYDGREHFEVADTLRSYAKWLTDLGREEEAGYIKKQAKAIKRRCEEGLYASYSREDTTSREHSSSVSTTPKQPKAPGMISIASALPPLKKKSIVS